VWSLFPELLGPMILAFVLGSVVAWAFLGIVLRRYPSERAADEHASPRGP
jgi:hypothetical protein